MAAVNAYHSPVAQAARALFPAVLLAHAQTADREEASAPEWLLALLRALRPARATGPASRTAPESLPPATPVRAGSAQADLPEAAPVATSHQAENLSTQPHVPDNIPSLSHLAEHPTALRAARVRTPWQDEKSTIQAQTGPVIQEGPEVSPTQQHTPPPFSPAPVRLQAPGQGPSTRPAGGPLHTAPTAASLQQTANHAPSRQPPADRSSLYPPVSAHPRPVSVEVTLRAADDLAAALAESDEITRAIYRTIARVLSER